MGDAGEEGTLKHMYLKAILSHYGRSEVNIYGFKRIQIPPEMFIFMTVTHSDVSTLFEYSYTFP